MGSIPTAGSRRMRADFRKCPARNVAEESPGLGHDLQGLENRLAAGGGQAHLDDAVAGMNVVEPQVDRAVHSAGLPGHVERAGARLAVHENS